MIPASLDFWCYTRRRGKYAPRNLPGFLKHAFIDALPDEAVGLLRVGDCIVMGTMDDWKSWLVMYLSGAPLSHVAIYVGNRTIAHATVDGVREDSLDSLFGTGNVLLPLIAPLQPQQRKEVRLAARQFAGEPYGWKWVYRKGIWRVTGRDWPHFRWKFAADIALVLLLIGLTLARFAGGSKLIAVAPVCLYFSIIVVGYVLWRRFPVGLADAGSPTDFLLAVRGAGWRPIMDMRSTLPPAGARTISTDLYVFAHSTRLPTVEKWRETMQQEARGWRFALNSLAPGSTGALHHEQSRVRVSVRSSTAEVQRLAIVERDLRQFDTCIRFDCDGDADSALASVRAAAAFAMLSDGTTYNPASEEPFIECSDVPAWSERCTAALRDLMTPTA